MKEKNKGIGKLLTSICVVLLLAFAFSIGKIANGLSTSVNAVINQPSTETFVRFDGSVLPQNDAINGNLIFESKKLMDFVNSNSDKFKLKPEYDYPLALTLELKSNKQKIEVTNFAVKYGDSAGAGNLLIPLSAGPLLLIRSFSYSIPGFHRLSVQIH